MNMENNLYGIYDAINDRPNYLRHSTDQQYNSNVRLGGMLNLTFLSADGNHKLQLKNIFNQLATSRYTWRKGVSAQSNVEHSAEYYYRIGKRIIGVGRSEGTTGSDDNARVPHSYEMPRNSIDLSVAKKFGTHWELKFNVRDLLAEKVYYKQFAEVTYSDGSRKEVEEVSRCYKPGRNIGLQAVYKF